MLQDGRKLMDHPEDCLQDAALCAFCHCVDMLLRARKASCKV